MQKTKIKKIILHCSDSSFGCAGLINEWHKGKGWSGIGYQLVILNGYPTALNWQAGNRISFLDGSVETGRVNNFDMWVDSNEIGAHALGYNRESIGICFILKNGKINLTDKQLETGLSVVKYLISKYSLTIDDVLGHYELDRKKTCPDFDVGKFRNVIRFARHLNGIYNE